MKRLTNYYINKNGCRMYERADNSVKNQQLIDKLGKYEDAEEQGLLLRLPCVENTAVYIIEDECTNLFDYCKRKGNCKDCPYRNLHIVTEYLSLSEIVLRLNDFGKTIFLTKEESEQKLKEMESD